MPSKRPRLAEVACPMLRNAVFAAKVPMAARWPGDGSLPLDMMLRSCRWHWSRQQSVKQVECVMRWRSSRWTTRFELNPPRAGPKLLSAPTPEGSGPMAGLKTPRWPHKIGKPGSWDRTPGLCYANPRPSSSEDPIIRGPASRYRYRWLSVAAVVWPICSSLLSGSDCFSHHRTPISLTLLLSISFFPRRPSLCQTQDGV